MARRSQGGMSLPERIRPEAIRPVASPVNTYARPDSSGVDEATAKAQYLEQTLAAVERPLTKMYNENIEERTKEAKLQATLDAYGDYYKWYGETAPSLEGVPPEKVSEVWQQKFAERFGQEPDRLKSFALKELLASSIRSEAVQSSNKRAAAIEAERYDKWTVGLNGQLADAAKRGAPAEERQALIQSHFDAAASSGYDKRELTKRMLKTQADMLAGDDRTKWDTSILDHIKAKKLDQTQNPDYNTLIDQITNKIAAPTNVEKEQYQIGFAREAEELVSRGVSKKTFEQWFDKKFTEGAVGFGVGDAHRNRYISQIDERDKRAAELGARNAVLNKVGENFLATGFVPTTSISYAVNGSAKSLSETDVQSAIRSKGAEVYGLGTPQYMVHVASKVKVPEFEMILNAGARAITTLNADKEQVTYKDAQGNVINTTKSAQALTQSFELYRRLKEAGAEKVQVPDEKTRELFDDYLNLRNMGYQDSQISQMFANARNSGVTVPAQALDARVKGIQNTTMWDWTGWKSDANNGVYVKDTLKSTVKRLAAYSGSNDYDSMFAEATRRFEENHAQSPNGKSLLFVGDPKIPKMFGSKENFLAAVDVVTERIEENYRAQRKAQGLSVPKGVVQLAPMPGGQGRYIVTYDGMNPLADFDTITVDTIAKSYNAIKAEQQNKELAKQRK